MQRRFRAFPVVQGEAPIGLISVNQVREIPRSEWAWRTAGDTMTPLDEAITVRPDDPLSAVLDKVRTAPSRRVLVVGNGRLEGFITARDLAAWLGRLGPAES
jgi:CBS domain-containing protein